MNDTTQHTSALRVQLVKLAGMRARSEQAEKNIQTAAGKRLEAVEADIKALRPRVFLDDGAARQYDGLTLERGRLQRILMGDKA
jgi:hypothetical protein